MKSKVLAALKLPVRLLTPLAKPLRRIRALKGRQQVAFFVVLAAAAVALVLVLEPGGGDDAKDVRSTLARFAEATREKDYQTLCDDLLATAFVEKIRSVGLPCEVALKTGLDTRQNPQLEVLGVEVRGEQALARTRSTAAGERPSEDVLRLIREDGSWRIASTPSGQTAPAP